MSDRVVKRFVNRELCIPIFYDHDLPNAATHCSQVECGYSFYRGVLVQWDEDHDPRVLDFIDELAEEDRGATLVVQEHEGTLSLLWRTPVPTRYQQGEDVEVRGDVWSIVLSKSILPSVED